MSLEILELLSIWVTHYVLSNFQKKKTRKNMKKQNTIHILYSCSCIEKKKKKITELQNIWEKIENRLHYYLFLASKCQIGYRFLIAKVYIVVENWLRIKFYDFWTSNYYCCENNQLFPVQCAIWIIKRDHAKNLQQLPHQTLVYVWHFLFMQENYFEIPMFFFAWNE